jgi:predicted unusual protein kinase regulating ubiquinone biosynthesis (AarF/ABC1/UbiB family)
MPPADESSATRTARHALRAVELRELLTTLGPTFIKFGQALSIRPDVLSPAAIYELQKLCDAVPSYPTPLALELIEAELGSPPSALFTDLDERTQPIAAASLGQVYRCRTREGGHVVALKVQRPDMIRAVSLDLFLLRRYMQLVEGFKKTVLTGVFGAADRDPFDVNLLDTFARASFLELDYRHEAANMERFRHELVPRLGGKVCVPECHSSLTSRKVIATDWVEGEQLAKSPPEVINELIPTGVACFLSQLLDVGFFHSDPHPGNLLVDRRGRLVLIDFGLCAEIEAFDTRRLTTAIVHLMRGDVEGLVEDAITLRFLPADVDKAALLPPLKRVFKNGRLAAASHLAKRNGAAAASGETDKAKGGKGRRSSEYAAVATKRAQFAAISRDLNQIFFEFPFAVPEYFALITRALIVLEGIALTGDPDFDLFQAAYPLALGHAGRTFGAAQLASLLGEARAAAAAVEQDGQHPQRHAAAEEEQEQQVQKRDRVRALKRTLSLKTTAAAPSAAS